MPNLSIDERIDLQNILIEYFNSREKPGQHLKSLINISSIQINIEEIDFSLTVRELIPYFYGQILKDKKNLVSFFKVLQSHLREDSDDRFTVKTIIEKLERLQPSQRSTSPSSKPPNYNNLLTQERQKSQELSESQRFNKIDNNLLIMYDLKDLKEKLEKKLCNVYGGILAFNIIDNYQILSHDNIFESYIIKTIEKELDYRQRNYHKPIYLNLPCSYETIEKKLENHIKDLLDDNNLDVIFIVKYESYDKTQLNSTAQSLLKEIQANYSDYFNDTRYLIIIFGSLYFESHLDEFDSLPIPKKFEVQIQENIECPLTKWFKYCLVRHEIKTEMQGLYIRELRNHIINHQGNLIQTYKFLQKIFL